jgi:co-chaperonin GroES (HSP10)
MSKSITGCIGHSMGDYTPASIEAFHDKVALKVVDIGSFRTENGIIIPESAEINHRLGLYEVLSVGDEAAEEYGLKEGDYVYADRLSVFYDTSPICVMKFENIICLTDEKGVSLFPLKNMVFVDEIKKDDVYADEDSPLFIASKTQYVPIGIITEINIDKKKYPYIHVGDKIIMTQGADQCHIKGKHFRIYKPDMIIATVDE